MQPSQTEMTSHPSKPKEAKADNYCKDDQCPTSTTGHPPIMIPPLALQAVHSSQNNPVLLQTHHVPNSKNYQ